MINPQSRGIEMGKKLFYAFMTVLFMLLVIMGAGSGTAEAKSPSKTVTKSFLSKALKTDSTAGSHKMTYKVYLPEGYNKKRKKPYPVIYLLHGSSGNQDSWDDFWEELDQLIREKKIEPVIAAVPSGGNSYWVNSKKYGNMETAVIKDLIHEVDRVYHTESSRSGRYIAGYSMGGYGALRYSLRYPHLFSGSILLSPAIQDQLPPATSGAVERGSFGEPFRPELWTALNYPAALEAYKKQPYRVPFYIVTGDDDWNHLSEKEDLPSDAWIYNMEYQAVRLYEELHRKNLFDLAFPKWGEVPANPAELRIVDGGHGLEVWRKGFREGMKYLFGQEESAELSPVFDPGKYKAKQKGTVSVHSFPADRLKEDQTEGRDELSYTLYLPPGYGKTNKRYPAVYLLHGSGGDETAWSPFWPIIDSLIEQKKIPPFIAAAPVSGNSYWVDSKKYGAIESAILDDLIPEVDRKYRTIAARDGRALAGFSMGGYGALRYALANPSLFTGAVLLSPAVQNAEAPPTSGAVTRGAFGDPFEPARWEALNYPRTVQQYGQQQQEVPIFIAAGDDDWNHLSEQDDLPEDASKYNMEVQSVLLYEALHRVNLFNRPFDKWEDVPGSPAELRIFNGGHGMDVWAAGFEAGLPYLFGHGLSGPQ